MEISISIEAYVDLSTSIEGEGVVRRSGIVRYACSWEYLLKEAMKGEFTWGWMDKLIFFFFFPLSVSDEDAESLEGLQDGEEVRPKHNDAIFSSRLAAFCIEGDTCTEHSWGVCTPALFSPFTFLPESRMWTSFVWLPLAEKCKKRRSQVVYRPTSRIHSTRGNGCLFFLFSSLFLSSLSLLL